MNRLIKPANLLEINQSLGINERKLLNLFFHHLSVLSVKYNVKPATRSRLEVNVRRHNIHQTLDKYNETPFRLSMVVKSINNKQIFLSNKHSTNLISPIEINKQRATLSFDPVYNKLILGSDLFYIDREIHRNIVKKNSLVIYEILLAQIKFQYESFKLINKYQMSLEINVNTLALKLGRERYGDKHSSEIVRSVIKVAVIELNDLNVGFVLDAKKTGTMPKDNNINTYVFVIQLTNLDYINKLISD